MKRFDTWVNRLLSLGLNANIKGSNLSVTLAESCLARIKRLYWYTRFGPVEINQQTYRQVASRTQVRPLSSAAQVKCRGYSTPLQRAITDFGADHSFGEIAKKLKQHYHIEAPTSSSRLITQPHSEAMVENQQSSSEIPEGGLSLLIVEMDATMLPIVEIVEKQGETVPQTAAN